MERASARDIAERLLTILWWSRAMERAPARDIAEPLGTVSVCCYQRQTEGGTGCVAMKYVLKFLIKIYTHFTLILCR
jgi:hypothetical protein